ncbi:MAG: RNA-binding S4 domain-containing protein [bacterium]|nr:RNA-binding S4 domain-containing protein [bacterium]
MATKFKIDGAYIELIKLLKATGLCGTGGMAKMVVEDGLVLVDGEVELRKRCKLKSGQTVRFDGTLIELE